MSPVPRCNLRLPNDSSERTPIPSGKNPSSRSSSSSSSSNISSGKMKRANEEDEEYGNVPESAHDEVSRDSAEVLEGASEFRTSVTRDSAEVKEHGEAETAGLRESVDACELLKRCKAEVEQATANGECEQMKCPNLEAIGTPGDVCAQFCHDRQDSPKSTKLEVSGGGSQKHCKKWGRRGPPIRCDVKISSGDREARKEVVCKGTYKSTQVYTSLWGSGKAIDYRKKLESQMKKKRKLLEKMHLNEFLRRQKMRRRAKQKRAALKQKDQSKIPTGEDKLRINKAYDLRVNYNKQLPIMPAVMRRHMDKFKKPPFKEYVTGKKVCTKRIDEFEKLRVPDDK